MQAAKATFLKVVKITIAMALVVCAAVIAFEILFPTRYSDCDRHTKLLHGGPKTYGGKKFDVVLCGTGWDKNRMNDWVRLQVRSDEGALLAQRSFRVDWDTNFPRELEYGPDYLTYYDASQQDDFEHRISMPPTWWDWVRARLPLLN
jgi:hypothetical protein